MNPEDAEEYTQSLGQIMVGSWRQIAWADRQGIPAALGMTTDQWVRERLGGYIKMAMPDRREAVKELTAEGHSQREIGAILGVDQKTVSNDLREENSSDDRQEPCDIEENSSSSKADRRAEREAELAAKQRALPTNPYGVIYADPPWRFEPYSRDTGLDRAPDNHYPTMTLDAIKAMAVPAAADAVLFLWATSPMMPEALEVMRAWRFDYRSQFIWVKSKLGTGYWTRNQHELLLIGVRGKPPAPRMGDQYPSVITTARGEHSAKPFCFREMIEEMFPNLPRIELFARQQFSGWDSWGNEVEAA